MFPVGNSYARILVGGMSAYGIIQNKAVARQVKRPKMALKEDKEVSINMELTSTGEALSLGEGQGAIRYQTYPMSPMGRNNMWTAGEGGVKTWLNCGESISLASGQPFLGMPVERSPVLMIDEETPTEDLEDRLNRLARGLGFNGYEELPITVASMRGFRFADRNLTAIREVEGLIKVTVAKMPDARNISIRIDSVVACLGAGLQSGHENNDGLGRIIQRTCAEIRRFCSEELGMTATITMMVHARKHYPLYDIDDLRHLDMQFFVRGHGSIVGLGSDIGYPIKKISQNPLRGVIVPIIRRTRSPMLETYFELEEERYMDGWARFKKIDPVPIPPSDLEVDYFSLFYANPGDSFKEQDLMRRAAAHDQEERRVALDHLKKHQVILRTSEDPFSYGLNPNAFDVDTRKADDLQYSEQLVQIYFDRGGEML